MTQIHASIWLTLLLIVPINSNTFLHMFTICITRPNKRTKPYFLIRVFLSLITLRFFVIFSLKFQLNFSYLYDLLYQMGLDVLFMERLFYSSSKHYLIPHSCMAFCLKDAQSVLTKRNIWTLANILDFWCSLIIVWYDQYEDN